MTLKRQLPRKFLDLTDTSHMINQKLEKIKKGMSYFYLEKFSFFNFNFTVQEVRECHRFICFCMNSFFNARKFNYYIFNSSIKKSFISLSFYIKKFFKRYSKLNKHFWIELLRFWKVKRVQIAKVIMDYQDSKISVLLIPEKIQNIFDNAFIYSLKKLRYSLLHYRFNIICKILYNLIFLDYYIYKNTSL